MKGEIALWPLRHLLGLYKFVSDGMRVFYLKFWNASDKNWTNLYLQIFYRQINMYQNNYIMLIKYFEKVIIVPQSINIRRYIIYSCWK